MKELIINDNNLKDSEIEEVVTRVKAIIVNDINEILLAYCDDEYQFPGGHLEKNEDYVKGLIRELKEETGMLVDSNDLECFMMIKEYVKNYRNCGKNRLNKIIYYVLNNNYDIDLSKAAFSDYEKKGGFKLELVPLDNVEEVLIKNGNHHAFAKLIVNEMLQVLKEYKKIYNKSDFVLKKAKKDA